MNFYKNNTLDIDTIEIHTHPEKEKEWRIIEKSIVSNSGSIFLLDAKSNRKIKINYDDIVAIESEDRMCNVKLSNNNMLLLESRLKSFEQSNSRKNFIRINNSVIINTNYLVSFKSSGNARIEILLKDNSTYLVNRYYIKKFKENLS